MRSKQKALLAAVAADDRKARDVVILDVRNLTLLADYFVLCSGATTTQVRAISDHIDERLSLVKVKPAHREGGERARWVLLDYGDVVIHVFLEEDRLFYNLERLWGDAPRIPMTTDGVVGIEGVGQNEKPAAQEQRVTKTPARQTP